MAVSAHSFVLAFPQFQDSPVSLVEVKLAEARRRVNTAVWGALADDGVSYLTAHLMTAQPAGESARKAGGDGAYFREYERLKRIVAQGYRVT
jgi:hypothetical protein